MIAVQEAHTTPMRANCTVCEHVKSQFIISLIRFVPAPSAIVRQRNNNPQQPRTIDPESVSKIKKKGRINWTTCASEWESLSSVAP